MKKHHVWDRVLLFLCALTALIAGLYLVYASLTRLDWPILKNAGAAAWPLPNALIPAGVGLLSVVLAVFLFLLPGRLFHRRRDFVVKKIENGELRIAIKAVENLVQKCVDMHDEIKLVRMNVQNAHGGVVIDLCIALANNISIPLAVASLQKQIKQYLLASSGIDVKEVRVSVETAMNLTENSPYIVPSDAAGEKPGDGKEKKKRPTHQRLFSRADEPAVVPQPPQAEEAAPEAPAPAQEEAQPEVTEAAPTEAEAAEADAEAEPAPAEQNEETEAETEAAADDEKEEPVNE